MSWTAWTERDVLRALDRKEWRSFREIYDRMRPRCPGTTGVVWMRAQVRRLVGLKKVEERPRPRPGMGKGRGPDEFRRR